MGAHEMPIPNCNPGHNCSEAYTCRANAATLKKGGLSAKTSEKAEPMVDLCLMDNSWIDDIVAGKEKHAEAAAVRDAVRLEERRMFTALVEDFFEDVGRIIGESVETYNKRAATSIQHYAWPPDRYVVRKPVYPAAELLIVLDRDGRRIKCTYEFTVFGGTTSKEVLVSPITVGDAHLYLRRSDGSEVMQDRIGSEILTRFFQRI